MRKPDARYVSDQVIKQRAISAAAGCDTAEQVRRFVINAFDPKPFKSAVESAGREWKISLQWAGKQAIEVRCSK